MCGLFFIMGVNGRLDPFFIHSVDVFSGSENLRGIDGDGDG